MCLPGRAAPRPFLGAHERLGLFRTIGSSPPAPARAHPWAPAGNWVCLFNRPPLMGFVGLTPDTSHLRLLFQLALFRTKAAAPQFQVSSLKLEDPEGLLPGPARLKLHPSNLKLLHELALFFQPLYPHTALLTSGRNDSYRPFPHPANWVCLARLRRSFKFEVGSVKTRPSVPPA